MGKNEKKSKKENCVIFLKFAIMVFLFFGAPKAALAGVLKVCTKDNLGNILSGSDIVLYSGGTEINNFLTTGADGCDSTSAYPDATYWGIDLWAEHSSVTETGSGFTITRSYEEKSDVVEDVVVPGTYNLVLDVEMASLTFRAESCNTGALITNGFILHYGGLSISDDDYDGIISFNNNIYPTIYNGVYISATNYADSDSVVVAISSNTSRIINLCCNEFWGSVRGTVSDTDGNPVANAYLVVDGVELPGFPTNASGNYLISPVPSGTYNNVTVRTASGNLVAAEPPRTVVVENNLTATENFIMKSVVSGWAYDWITPINESSVEQDADAPFNVAIYFSEPADTAGVPVYVNGDVSGTSDSRFIIFSGQLSYFYRFGVNLPAVDFPVGVYNANISWTFNGVTTPFGAPDRTVNVVSPAGNNTVSGDVEICGDDPYYNFWNIFFGFTMLPDVDIINVANSAIIGVTDFFGLYSASLPVGTYSLYARKSGFLDSIIKTADLTAGDAVVDFCLSTMTGTLNGYIEDTSGNPLDNVDIYIDGIYFDNTSNFAIAGQPGWFSVRLPAGTYSTRFVKNTFSNTFSITINVNQTTSGSFTLQEAGGGVTLFVTLLVSPSFGSVPFSTQLTTSVSGTATGVITYSNRDCDGGTISGVSGGSFTCAYNSTGTYYPSITATRQGITKTDSVAVTATSDLDIGLRAYDGGIISIAAKTADNTTPLRIFKNGVTYGIILVDPSDSNASHIRIEVNGSTKAFKRY